MKQPTISRAALGFALAAATTLAQSSEGGERKPFEPTSIKAPFLEQFTPDWQSRWSPSSATKKQSGGEVFSYVGQWSVEEPTVFPGLQGDAGLVAKSKAAQHAISAPFAEVVDPKAAALEGKPLVVQYETKLQNGLSCGGAYLKLLTESPEGIQAKEFSDNTPYTIMFGPDKCGATNKVHFIFRHKDPVTGEVTEKHLVNAPYAKIAKVSTLYTLIVNPDSTFEILINNEQRKNGTLFDDFDPPVNPAKEIDDVTDVKPSDWVDVVRIPDPSASKPDDWDEDAPAEIADEEAVKPEGWLDDEPLMTADPEAVKPEEWDDDEDGEWVAPTIVNPKCTEAPGCGPWTRPTIRNPAYKGKWTAPMIDNPAYKGEWKPKRIPNPNFYEDKNPNHFSPIAGIGYEIWTMDEDILFDNIYVGHSIEDAREFARETFDVKLPIEQNIEKVELDAKKEEDAKATSGSNSALGLERLRNTLQDFYTELRIDPVEAIKAQPSVAGLIGVLLAGLLGIFGFISSLVAGGSSSKPVASAKASAKKVESAAAAKGKSTAIAAKEPAKKRTAKAATAQDDEDEE
jgi:calnexin